jgi:glycogen synthase
LVSDKGVDTLLDALGLLAARGLRPRLTVVGDGPEREPLAAQARRLGIAGQVGFLGSRQGPELPRLLNAHRILVVPSRYDEPFGIVALEGIACGCLVIGSRGGGLREAIGACGLTFRNGDSGELADLLAAALADPGRLLPPPAEVAAHLELHASARVVATYLDVIGRAVA